jgi:dienelactone hydrolase
MAAEELAAVVDCLRDSGCSSSIAMHGFCQGGLAVLGAASVPALRIQAVVSGWLSVWLCSATA